MIIQFHTRDITFFPEDQAYFEKRISSLKKFLGNDIGDEDSVKADIHVEKDKHHKGERFHAKSHIVAPHGGNFHAEADAESIQALADLLRDTLEIQVKKFHDKRR